MTDILLDTNFIVSCIREKIDFFEQLEELFPSSKILIPPQVIKEIEKLSGKGKIVDREAAELSLAIISKKEKQFEISDLRTSKVDKGILNFTRSKANKTSKLILATLDRALRKKIKSRFNGIRLLTIRGKKISIL